MNQSLHRAFTIHSTWGALPLFPVSELRDAAPLNPYIDEVRSFLGQRLTNDEREYACLCSDFSQGLQRHEDFQGPLAARLFAIGTRHWLVGQDVKKPHSNTGMLMSGSFWKSYSAECIRTFAPDRSLDWRSHVAAVSGFTKSLIKATWGNANTQYYCQRQELGDRHEVVMDSLGMISLSPGAGCALVFHEFLHGIKDSNDTFLKMFESARRRGYKGTKEDLHPFFNQYEDIAMNVAGGSVLVDGMEDFRELYKGMFLINAYSLKKNYSIDSEFWVCSMARALGETQLPFTPSAEVLALIVKHCEALDELTGPHSLPISKKGVIRRDVCIDPAKLAVFSNYRGEAEARLYFKLQEEFAGQQGQVQNLDSQSLSQARQPDTGQPQKQKPGHPSDQETSEASQDKSVRSDPTAMGQDPGDHEEKNAGAQKLAPEQSGAPLKEAQDSAPRGSQPTPKKEPAGNGASAPEFQSPVPQANESADRDGQPETGEGKGHDPNAQEAGPEDPSKESSASPSVGGVSNEPTAPQGENPSAPQQNAGPQGIEPGRQQNAENNIPPDGTREANATGESPADQGKDAGSQASGSGPQSGQGVDPNGPREPSGSGGNGEGQEDQPQGAGSQQVAVNSDGSPGPDFSGLGEVGDGFDLSEPILIGAGPDGSTSADPEGKFKALEKHVPRGGAAREDLLQDGILGYGAPVDMSALSEVQLEFATVIRRGKRLFQGIRENAERAVQHRAKLVEEGETFSITGMALRRSDPEHTLIFENPAQAIAVNHARFGMILDMSGSTERGHRFKRLVEMAAVAALTIEDSGYQTALGLFSSQGLLLYHAEYPKHEKLRRLGGLVKVVRHSQDLQTGGASVGLTRELGFMGGTESEKAVGTFVEAITKTQSRKPGHFHGMIFTDGGLTEDRLQSLITANPKLTWSVLCEGVVTQEAEDHFGKENTHAVQLDGDFIKTIFGAFSQSIKKFGSFQSASKIRKHYQETLRDARRMPPENAINEIK
jgi:hypothetical protein